MDIQKLLFEAACRGNVELLGKLLQEKPLILTNVALTCPPESLLHVATRAGQLDFVRELIKHNPELARESSEDGFMPMGIASMAGNVEIVKELVKVDNMICRLKGKDQRTALHYAAIKGRVGVIDLLLSTCPEAVADVTVHGETALQLAVKNHQFEAFRALLKRLENPSMESVLNWGDRNGNTVLHLAASTKQLQIIELLLSSSDDAIRRILKLNATNSKGLTALDLLDIVMKSPNDVQLREILRRAGALGAQDVSPIPSILSLQQVSESETQHEAQSEPPTDLFKYFKFQRQRDSPGDTRNALLVVAALISAVTFQAGMNPPTGLLESITISTSGNGPPGSVGPPVQEEIIPPVVTPGLAAIIGIIGSHSPPIRFLFLFANTLGLTASLSIIIYLTGGFPFQRELQVSIFTMIFVYGLSINSMIEKKEEIITNLLLVVAFFLPFSMRWLIWWGNKVWKWLRANNQANEGPDNLSKI